MTAEGPVVQRRRRGRGLWLLLVLFVLVVCLVNPVRDMIYDDDFAYALMVRHLLQTGEYRLHDWAAASMPVQIYWGALLCQLFGYSFTTLRLSTLLLLLVGLLALYAFLRERGAGDTEASLLTLALFASPVVLNQSFTFMTDVQFMSWMILAFWLYARGLQRRSGFGMALASVAAAAAVGTRQFGIALVFGLTATWVSDREPARQAPLYLVGLALPTVMAFWQITAGLAHPSFSQAVRLGEQAAHVGTVGPFLQELLWRPTVILQYVGIFLLPLAPWCVLRVREQWNAEWPAKSGTDGHRPWPAWDAWLLGFWGLYITVGVVYGYVKRDLLMPSLPFILQRAPLRGPWIQVPLTLVTAAMAILLGWLLCRHYLTRKHWEVRSRPDTFLALAGLALLALQLIYVQFYDEYLLVFILFVLLALVPGRQQTPTWLRRTTVALGLGILLGTSLWTYRDLELDGAYWQAAEALHAMGVEPQRIATPLWPWHAYHGAFDEWVAVVRGKERIQIYDFIREYINPRNENAEYLVVESRQPPSGEAWHTLGRVSYQGLRRRHDLYLVRRESAQAW